MVDLYPESAGLHLFRGGESFSLDVVWLDVECDSTRFFFFGFFGVAYRGLGFVSDDVSISSSHAFTDSFPFGVNRLGFFFLFFHLLSNNFLGSLDDRRRFDFFLVGVFVGVFGPFLRSRRSLLPRFGISQKWQNESLQEFHNLSQVTIKLLCQNLIKIAPLESSLSVKIDFVNPTRRIGIIEFWSRKILQMGKGFNSITSKNVNTKRYERKSENSGRTFEWYIFRW